MRGIRANPGIALLIAAMTIWGGTYVISKAALEDLGPFTILALRFTVGWLALIPFAVRQGYRIRLSLTPVFLLFGLTGIVLHNGLETFGLQFTSAGTAALIIAAAPALTAGLSILMLGERLTLLRLLGIGLSIAGVVLISFGDSGAGDGAWLGNLLVFGGVVAWGLYTVQGKRLSVGHSGLVSTTAGAGAAVLFLVPLAAAEIALGDVPHFTAGSIAAVAYLGLLASAAAFALWNTALSYVEASVAGPFINLVPVIGLALAVAVGEPAGIAQLIGGGIVGLGVWLSSMNAFERRQPAARSGVSWA
ncbi:MAG: EamA family transporter [Actinomycetota bacterium]|nr:EamA family transporter [Actinomycetota bacterium]